MSARERGPVRASWLHLVRLGISILVLIAIAVLIILNLGTTTSFNLFGRTLHDLNVVVIAIGGFIVGVLYSFVYYVVSTIGRTRRARLKEREASVTKREADLKSRAGDGPPPTPPGSP